MHCLQLTKSTIAAEQKKKKKREKRSSKNVDAEIIWIQTVTKYIEEFASYRNSLTRERQHNKCEDFPHHLLVRVKILFTKNTNFLKLKFLSDPIYQLP